MFDLENAITLHAMQGNRASSRGEGEVSWVFSTCERIKTSYTGTSLVVQWFRFHSPNAGGWGLIPGQGTKILHATHAQLDK